MARGSGLTAPMLERQLVHVRDELQRAQRELKAVRDGAVQVPLVTIGQLNEIRAVANQLQQDAATAQALADSVTNWANRLEQFVIPPTPPASSPPEE